MKKLTTLLLLLYAAICGLCAHETATFIFNNDAIIVPSEGYTIPCMGYKDTVEVWLDDDFTPSSISSWDRSGEVDIIEVFAGKRGVKIVSTGAARGGLILSYDRGTCGGASASFVINKRFRPEDKKLVIKGPNCVITGQDVVYSVDPVLTKNLGSMIGMDSYYWNILEHKEELGFVDSIIYVSGDTSAVTFRVGDMDPLHMPVIEVMVGACNRYDTIRLKLGNATPAPVFETDTMFVPYGTNPFKVHLVEPDSDVTYTWECDYDHAAGFRLDTIHGDSVMVTPEKSAEADICTLIVTAEYNTITCNSTSSSIAIKRAWGDSIVVKAKYPDGRNKTDSCFHVGDIYSFNVSGKIPASSHCEWILPEGWIFKNPEDNHKHTVDVIPQAGALLTDTIRVRPLDRRDTASAKLFAVHVQPAQITAINAPSCVQRDLLQTFSIDTAGIFPHAKSFYWEIDAEVAFTGQGTTSISFEPTLGTTAVSVTAIGEEGCDAETYTQTLNLPPQRPDNIINDNECLWADSIDVLTLSVETPVSGQTYRWSLPAGWSAEYTATDSSSVTLTTNGVRGEYLVSVCAVGKGTCPNSPGTTYTIKVDTIDWYIDFIDLEALTGLPLGGTFIIKRGSMTINDKYADWYIGDVLKASHSRSLAVNDNDKPINSVTAIMEYCNLTFLWPNSHSTNQNIGIRRVKKDHNLILNLYPNPAQNTIMLQLREEKAYDLFILDINGNLIQEQIVYGMTAPVDVSHLPSGNYYFVVLDGEEQSAQQIVIRH